ncbi:MAG TPA: tetratricopeptide repeat protein [Rudaea sp.]|nr:tetratricopeptide repeat protein [Rudaea sp.]
MLPVLSAYRFLSRPWIPLAGLSAVLAACSHPPVKAPAPDTAGAVAAIRALGAHYESSVQVHAVRDPAVNGFLDAAHAQEAKGQFHAAQADADKALKIAPRAPEILQYAAELAIESGDWKRAGELARQSWDLGSKVGGLCARNLETQARALVVQGDDAAAAQARAKIEACRVPPVTRF